MQNITLVTGLWNIKRDQLNQGWSRSFDHYLQKLEELLRVETNLIIFGEEEIREFVESRRNSDNTQFIVRDTEWFKNTVPYDKIQEIRNNPSWYNQSTWLKDSTQGSLEMYNPLVMSKMFLLNDARILDKFNSTHLFWIDAGITNTVHPGYFTHDKIQDKLPNLFNDFGFIAFPYNANNEIHGFSYPKINEYANFDVKLVCRGGLFGGTKNSISNINGLYYDILNTTLNDGYMGTEESLFSILLYRHPDLIEYVEIDENGLFGKFCEDLKNDTCIVTSLVGRVKKEPLNTDNVALYVITFNSPKQFETLVKSYIEYDIDFIEKPKK
jgi:hypothetical protein